MRTLLAGAALLALTFPAHAQDATCPDKWRTIADDKSVSEDHGFTYLGLRKLPFTDAQAVFYARDGVTWLSVQMDGCVSPTARAFGPYVPEQGI